MTVYLDTSVVVPLFVEDDHARRARAWAASGPSIAISAWTAAEFSSAISMQVCMKRFTENERLAFEDAFDAWVRKGRMLDFEPDLFAEARRLLHKHRRLRAPDALHLAIAQSHGLKLATLDDVLKEAAIADGLEVVDL